ncbi:hypothetical protein CKJ76_25120 [Mycobacterium avium]|uniref:Helix-turn-helix domain-containing protein n=1 Tax=Mycobacterium intracellulare subsp. chimaera TaxID=222805 RepID=A0ABT7P637_MYCIT|nr:helix-turn-helix domain-containing protein [Mycobacterium intracellulare]MDM3928742.1 helix-turn-helix domain-containing protein [Mycobacterium intracellulare subsp. chimaera]PBA69097.1 hypothetical protein CKJ76_25120 [Mycobacterium avium]
MGRWDSLRGPRGPLQYTRRGPHEQAADARRAFDVLQPGRPPSLSETVYQRYLEVLKARMSDSSASLAELALRMSPPMSKDAFAAHLRRAHDAAGVSITRESFV